MSLLSTLKIVREKIIEPYYTAALMQPAGSPSLTDRYVRSYSVALYMYIHMHMHPRENLQWNLCITDTLGPAKSVQIIKVS